jgi:hypothetical protein
MRTGQTNKRLERLTASIRPNGRREFTLEELCRSWWRTDKQSFLTYIKEEYSAFQVFADAFEREDAERASRAHRGRK